MYAWDDPGVVLSHAKSYSPEKQADTISRHRKELGGTLFFDRILSSSLGLKQPTKVYPPKSTADLKDLWAKVCQSQILVEQKLAILYYLVRDCHSGSTETTFLRKTCLPPKYSAFIAGIHELDHAQFLKAIEHLTDPSITGEPTFADEILLILLQHPKCDRSLATAYYLTVQPPLRSTKTLDAYFKLLTNTNVVEAYEFAKTHGDHRTLFEQLVVSVHEEQAGDDRAKRALQLVGLPFTQEEEQWFEDCLIDGKASKLSGAKDTVLMRKFTKGQLKASTGVLNRTKGQKLHGINWEDIRRITVG